MADQPKPMMPNFTGTPVSFLQEVRAELAKVVWPGRDDVIKLTIVVILVSLLLGLYIGGLDLLFTKITDALLNR